MAIWTSAAELSLASAGPENWRSDLVGGAPGRAMNPAVARVRLTFAKEPRLRFIGHLDLARAWERALRRANLPVAWTQGFTPRVRLSFAAPLSLGTVACRELADVFFTEPVPPDEVLTRLGEQLPQGCNLTGATAVPVAAASLPSMVRWASYEVALWSPRSTQSVEAVVDVSGGSRWSRRVPDEASLVVTGATHSLGQVRRDIPDGEAPPELQLVAAEGTRRRTGRDSFGAEPLIARPDAGNEMTESPLRPVSEWLRHEDPDHGPPPRKEVEARLKQFLASPSVVVSRSRDGKTGVVETRGAVEDAVVVDDGSGVVVRSPFLDMDWPDDAPRLAVVVRHDASGAGRPDDVAAALGYEVRGIVRRAIVIEGEPMPLVR